MEGEKDDMLWVAEGKDAMTEERKEYVDKWFGNWIGQYDFHGAVRNGRSWWFDRPPYRM